MLFFNGDAHVRINTELMEKIDEILNSDRERFDSQSHVVRAAINSFHKQICEVKE
jgi:Arc/MetJ-type ribon-helix-helix transcriptional regulator